MNLVDSIAKDVLEVGDFWWEDLNWKKENKEPAESAKLFVCFPPTPGIKPKYEIHWVPCSTTGGNTAKDRMWNGYYKKPTIKGSWDIKHFHSWVIDGELRDDVN